MRLCLALTLTALVTQASAQQAPGQLSPPPTTKGIIRGVITADETRRPIRGAEVRIETPAAVSPSDVRFAVTDENGRYEIRDLDAGRYTLSASKVGFATVTYGQRRPVDPGRAVDVRPGAIANAIDIALPRGGVIVARIVDGFGVPVAGLTVRPFQYQFVEGQRQLRPAFPVIGNVSDDRGEVRVFGLASGDYFLAAIPQFSGSIADHNYIQTLYPGTTLFSEAQAIRVGPGEEISVSWRVAQQRRVRMSGIVFDSTGAPAANAAVQLRFEQLASFSTKDVTTAADGTFRAENLAPGAYVVNVRALQISHPLRIVDDVAGLVLKAPKTTRLQGRILFDRPDDQPRFTSLRIQPVPAPVSIAGFPVTVALPVKPDGTFDMATAVSTGVLQLPRVPGSPEWFLKSIIVDGRELPPSSPLDLASLDGRPLQIFVTRERGTLTGAVVDRRGNAVPDCSVIVFPVDNAEWTPFTDRIAATRVNGEGRFELRGLPPGRYLVGAVDSLETGEERYPPTLERLRGFTITVAVSDGQTQAANLRLDR